MSFTEGPFIVLEGPDGSGKTTLAEALVKVGFQYKHCGPPEEDAYEFWSRQVRETEGLTVFDRLHVGSFVYGNVFRSHDDMVPYERWLFEGYLMRHHALMIYTRPTSEEMDKNLNKGERGPDSVYESKAEEVRELYGEFFDPWASMTELPTLHYDYTKINEVNVIAATYAGLVMGYHADPPIVPLRIPALGNVRTPRYVFVGDEPRARAKLLAREKKHGWPTNSLCERAERLSTARVPFDSQSGRYLFTALHTSGLNLKDYCLINSTMLDGEKLKEFIIRTPEFAEASIVALGNNASRELDAAEIEHRTVPHPQYVKRFHYKAGLLKYPEMLTGVLPVNALEL